MQYENVFTNLSDAQYQTFLANVDELKMISPNVDYPINVVTIQFVPNWETEMKI